MRSSQGLRSQSGRALLAFVLLAFLKKIQGRGLSTDLTESTEHFAGAWRLVEMHELSIQQWLESIDPVLGCYAGQFMELGYDNVKLLSMVDESELSDDLKEMKVKKLHCRLILKRFAELKAEPQAPPRRPEMHSSTNPWECPRKLGAFELGTLCGLFIRGRTYLFLFVFLLSNPKQGSEPGKKAHALGAYLWL